MSKLNKLKFIDITAECFIELLKGDEIQKSVIFENNFPKDAEIVKVELNPNRDYFDKDIDKHIIRIIFCSDKFEELFEGYKIPRFILKFNKIEK